MRKIALLLTMVVVTACAAQNVYFYEQYGIISVNYQGTTWQQIAPSGVKVISHGWTGRNSLSLTIQENGREMRVQWEIKWPELRFKISSAENANFAYPWPFIRKPTSDQSEKLLLPVAEGVLYPAHDQSIRPYGWLKNYAGYGTSLPVFGVMNDSGSGYGFYTETPDYSEFLVNWNNQWTVTPNWQPGQTSFGERTGRFLFFQEKSAEEGVTRIAKWYRAYLKEAGYLVPLKKKKTKSAKPQALVACPQVWVWSDPLETARFLDSLGIDRALLANVDPKYWTVNKEVIGQIHAMGFLTSRYDNYEDRWSDSLSAATEWTEGYPEGLIQVKSGEFVPAWEKIGPDGRGYTGAKLCSAWGKKLIKKNLPRELKKLPYSSRFIDTITATELRECFSPTHPHDRTGDRKDRMALLDYSRRQVLTGSEKMTWWGIKVCQYSLGILSLNPYPPADDIGANPSRILEEVKEDYLRFNVGYLYRFPFFELVAHNCLLPTWYWGDGNNKHPGSWRKKDLLTILYGGVPMWCFATVEEMRPYADSLQNSYCFVRPTLLAIGLSEMTSFRSLNPAKSVQQTSWSNGVVVTVNFNPYPVKVNLNGQMVEIPARGYHLKTKNTTSIKS